MKNLLEVEKSLYRDIFTTILLVLISIPIWLNFDVSSLEIAKKYDHYNYIEYEFLNEPSYSLLPVSDNYALSTYETQDVMVYNNSNTIQGYSLLLKVNKNSTANRDNLKVNVNYNVDYLNNFNSYEDNDYVYYILDNKEIVASSQKYVISMWNDENAKISENDTLDYEFAIA